MVRTDYNEIANFYDEDKVREKSVDENLVKYLKKDKRPGNKNIKILDIACGTGNQLIAHKRAYPEIEMWGMDKFEKMLELAKKKAQDITWLQGDMDQDDLNIGTFDFISSQFAYHHSRNKQQFLLNVYNNLKINGWFTIINLDVFEMEDWFIYQFFPAAKEIDWQDFLETGLLLEKAQSVGFELVSQKVTKYRENNFIEDIYHLCAKRHYCSELISISDHEFNNGLSMINAKLSQDNNLVIESSVAIFEAIFKKS